MIVSSAQSTYVALSKYLTFCRVDRAWHQNENIRCKYNQTLYSRGTTGKRKKGEGERGVIDKQLFPATMGFAGSRTDCRKNEKKVSTTCMRKSAQRSSCLLLAAVLLSTLTNSATGVRDAPMTCSACSLSPMLEAGAYTLPAEVRNLCCTRRDHNAMERNQ